MNRKNPAPPPSTGNTGVPGQHFRGVALPSDDFRSVQNQLRTKPVFYELDLSVARSIAAGSHVVIVAAANSFYVDANNDVGNASVHFQSDALTARTPPIYVGPQFIARVPFVSLLIENTAQPGKVLRFVYGVDIDFVPGLNNQVVISNAILLDPATARYYTFGDYETQSGQSFVAATRAGPTAAQNSYVQLWNPGASGKILYVDQIDGCQETVADSLQLYSHNAAIGALVTQGINKIIGGAAGVAQLRSTTLAAPVGTVIDIMDTATHQNVSFGLKSPIEVPPGFGLNLGTSSTNGILAGSFKWREKTT